MEPADKALQLSAEDRQSAPPAKGPGTELNKEGCCVHPGRQTQPYKLLSIMLSSKPSENPSTRKADPQLNIFEHSTLIEDDCLKAIELFE
jgi:hypothetical protein